MASESELLRQIAERSAGLAARHGHVLVGPGDDCAVVRAGQNQAAGLLALSVDQLVEGRHFSPGTSPDAIARKAMSRAVSDLAAMAARPAWSLAAGVLASGDPRAEALCERLAHWGEAMGVPVVGGDLATFGAGPPCGGGSAGSMVLSITVAGTFASGERPVLRTGAQAGDGLYVSGRIGNSFESGRHLTFTPRVAESLELRRVLGDRLHAMIDVSDGVGRDAGRLAAASGVGLEVEATRVPLHNDARGRAGVANEPSTPEADVTRAIADGEDYELLFAAAGEVPEYVLSADGTQTSLTRIGRCVAAEPGACWLLFGDGRRLDVRTAGWDHA